LLLLSLVFVDRVGRRLILPGLFDLRREYRDRVAVGVERRLARIAHRLRLDDEDLLVGHLLDEADVDDGVDDDVVLHHHRADELRLLERIRALVADQIATSSLGSRKRGGGTKI
jgi:hypothetical protein